MIKFCTGLETDPRGNIKATRGGYGTSNERVYSAGGNFQRDHTIYNIEIKLLNFISTFQIVVAVNR